MISNEKIRQNLQALAESLAADVPTDSVFNCVSLEHDPPKGQNDSNVSKVLRVNHLVTSKTEDYRTEFEKDRVDMEGVSSEKQEFTSFYFFQKYGSRIGSKSEKLPKGVSFFDNLRIKEAIHRNPGISEFLLLKGDLTGIQEFIYADIQKSEVGGSKGIAKRVRGKSFFISLLTDLLAEMYLDSLGLPLWNLIFAGGGHFNLLIPKEENTEKKISEITKDINLYLQNLLSFRLGLITAVEDCKNNIETDAADSFKKVNNRRNALKFKSFQGYLDNIFFPKKKPSGFNFNKMCEDIGAIIPHSKYLIQLKNEGKIKETDSVKRLWFFKPKNQPFTRTTLMVRGKDEAGKTEDSFDRILDFLEKNKSEIREAEIYVINDTDFLKNTESFRHFDFPVGFGFRFIGKATPTNEAGELLEFSELAKYNYKDPKTTESDYESDFYPQLSIMRLDVDDLGAIFGNGLKKGSPDGKVDLRQIAALSREMSLFFTGHFNETAEKYGVYVVYSGGDDAFVIGSWLNIIDFSKALVRDFQTFTRHNKDLHFSAGVFTCAPNYPVSRFHKDAAETEEKAKSGDKNQIHIFNHTLSWEGFDSMINFGEKVFKITSGKEVKDSKKLSKSLIYKLLGIIKSGFYEKSYTKKSGEFVKKGSLNVERFNRNMGNLRYLFARHGFTKQKIDEIEKDLIGEVINTILTSFSDKSVIKNYKVALNYVLLKLRRRRV